MSARSAESMNGIRLRECRICRPERAMSYLPRARLGVSPEARREAPIGPVRLRPLGRGFVWFRVPCFGVFILFPGGNGPIVHCEGRER